MLTFLILRFLPLNKFTLGRLSDNPHLQLLYISHSLEESILLYACIHAYTGKCTRIYKVYLHFHIFDCVTLCMYHRISFDCVV